MVAADGGADSLGGTGVIPEAIIGDLDSLACPDSWQSLTRLIYIAEQDTTDFEKCLYSVEAPLFIAVGFAGSRLDHTLASLHVLHRYIDKKSVLFMAGEDVCFAHHGNLQLTMQPGVRLSIFPLSETTFVASTGLEYPLNGLRLLSGELIGTSNRVTESEVSIHAVSGAYCIIVPMASLDTLISTVFRLPDGSVYAPNSE